jgi:predicted house-cleaning NTP pyrophosphatase (Maf/HAM1 superfamily)
MLLHRFERASGSSRQRVATTTDFAARRGVRFEVDAADIDEVGVPARAAAVEGRRASSGGEGEGGRGAASDDVILAADTVVAFGDSLLGKPKDAPTPNACWVCSRARRTLSSPACA